MGTGKELKYKGFLLSVYPPQFQAGKKLDKREILGKKEGRKQG